MASDDYTAPTTRATNDVITASIWNTDIVNNITAIFQGIVGDASADALMIHRHKSGTNAARPGAGNAGRLYYATDDPKVVWLDDGAAWIIVGGDVPRVRLTHTGNQSISDATATALAFATETYDNDTMRAAGDNTKITLTKAGAYLVQSGGAWGNNTTGYRLWTVRLDGTTQIAAVQDFASNSGTEQMMQSLSFVYRFTAAQFIETVVKHSAGGPISVAQASDYTPVFSATYLAG